MAFLVLHYMFSQFKKEAHMHVLGHLECVLTLSVSVCVLLWAGNLPSVYSPPSSCVSIGYKAGNVGS